MMRMGDDDGGGGDWGGGGGDDDAGEEDDDDESEEGKKKKKKKKGFMSKIIGYLIGAVVLAAVCCCVVIASMLGLLPSSPAIVGEWENVGTQTVKVKEKDEKGIDVEKEVSQDVVYTLKIDKTDDKSGTGVYTFLGPDENAAPKVSNFKWKDFDKEKKTVVFEMNSPDDKFWKDIKSPATFTFSTTTATPAQLTLTAGADAMTFTSTKVVAPAKDGGVKKGGGKRR